jgi:N-acetylglucosaminyldiphosphoundecaprenol N-acetyl-beta-D-mannosaminyltransferase
VVRVRARGKCNVLGVLVDPVNYRAVVEETMAAAREGRGFAVSPLAVHGIMTGVLDSEHRYRLNHLDVVTPDGQPVRWGMNLLYGTGLRDRVYGPVLMLQLCRAAASQRMPIYLYGSSSAVLERLQPALRVRVPGLIIGGAEPSKFRRTSSDEKAEIIGRIRDSGARMVFVGLGCPRQEIFAYEYREGLGLPIVVVGAAFDYHAGLLREPPALMQRTGLQWFYRLVEEPRRLWRRYLILNPAYLGLLGLQALGLWRPDPSNIRPPRRELMVG